MTPQIPEQLDLEIKELCNDGYKINAEAKDDGSIHLVFNNYPVPLGYKKQYIKLLLKIPASYPNGKPDMFWVDADLELSNGEFKQETGVTKDKIFGVEWIRFSGRV